MGAGIPNHFCQFSGHVQKSNIRTHHIKIFFHNLLSMYESTSDVPVGLEVFGRRGLIEASLVDLGYTLAGFAEARTAQKQIVTSNFIMCSSGSEVQHFGCEVWIARKFPVLLNNGRIAKCCISPSHVNVFFCCPRILIVSVQAGPHLLYVVVFHAPHSGAGDKRKEFWELLLNTLLNIKGQTIVFLCDANAKVGSCTSDSVGNYYEQNEDYNGRAFHNILKTFNLYAPNTFSEFVHVRV